MKWLRPGEARLLHRITHERGYFTKREMPAVDRLVARGILKKDQKICPNCGMHYVWTTQLTERGKIAVMILEVLSHKPDLLP